MDTYDFLYDMVKHCQTLPLNREARIVLRGNEMDFILQTINSEIIVTIKKNEQVWAHETTKQQQHQDLNYPCTYTK